MAEDKTIKKIDSTHSPRGEMGQKYLASGKLLAMRLWDEQGTGEPKPETAREYETIGYVLKGNAELHIDNQVITLEPGISWVVPRGVKHRYVINGPFEAVEATSPPARMYGRDT